MDVAAPAEVAPTAPEAAPFAPVHTGQRIEALDVVRGFALLGIFLMNIEFFNRTFTSFNEGMPRGLKGADWLASWFIAYFVQGKFWTIFSLLFGMGFAVMLVRAERAGRPFVQVYLRRILALAVFGAAHFVFVWDGDILFSYSVGALALLIVLYGKPKPLLMACAAVVGLGLLIDAKPLFGVAGGIAAAGLLGLYLRGEKQLRWRGVTMPVFCFILLLAGVAMCIAAGVFWLLPDAPTEPRLPLSVFGPLLLATGWLSWKYHAPVEKRSLRMAVSVYLFFGVAMTAGGLLQHFTPDPAVVSPSAASAIAAPPKPASAALGKSEKAKMTPEQRAAEIRAEREKQLKERATRNADELKAFTHGSYRDTVDWRARDFLEKAAGDAVFGVVLIGMFLLGTWFVRSGVMEDTAGHLDLFRKLAQFGLPLGIGLGLLGSLIAMSHTPGERYDGWGIARGLSTLGNLPACLGYVGLVVVLLHSRGVGRYIRVLGPLGRMALTNYLMQSLICMTWFYGFGFGHWGLPRAQQVLFVLAVYAAQIVFSHWWLARFRYGPMEWLWRGFTYRQVPPLRIAPDAQPTPPQAA